MTSDAATDPTPPVVRVLHGDPTPEELGIVVALLPVVGRAVAAPGTAWMSLLAEPSANSGGRSGQLVTEMCTWS